ncbi:MAG: UTP--glucose-1-phosphate uridylyltransferase, partial [Angelakisella sp.]
MKIRKAVIPAAGLGTRVLPATKSMPKEMLPIVDRPAIHYIVEEAVRSGITEILIITSRGKFSVEDYFDRSPELEQKLLASGKQQVYEEMLHIAGMANIQYVRQQQPKGLGHAILCAKTFVGNEPFAVLYGDDVIISPEGQEATRELCDAYDKYGKAVVGIKEVTAEAILKYSSLAVSP